MTGRAIADFRGSSEPLSSGQKSNHTRVITSGSSSTVAAGARPVDDSATEVNPPASVAVDRFTSGRFTCCLGYGEHFVTCPHHKERYL